MLKYTKSYDSMYLLPRSLFLDDTEDQSYIAVSIPSIIFVSYSNPWYILRVEEVRRAGVGGGL